MGIMLYIYPLYSLYIQEQVGEAGRCNCGRNPYDPYVCITFINHLGFLERIGYLLVHDGIVCDQHFNHSNSAEMVSEKE